MGSAIGAMVTSIDCNASVTVTIYICGLEEEYLFSGALFLYVLLLA